MTRVVRLMVTLLLAGLTLVFATGEVWAQDTPWKKRFHDGPTEDQLLVTLENFNEDGASVFFVCLPNIPNTVFGVGVITKKGNYYPDDDVEVSWGVDNDVLSNETWKSHKLTGQGGVVAEGQDAYKFTLAVANAQNQILFRTPNGSVAFDATGSGKALWDFLAFCGLFG